MVAHRDNPLGARTAVGKHRFFIDIGHMMTVR